MAPTLPKRGRLLEFALVVILIGTLGLFLLQALQDLQDESERLAVELTIRNMNSGLFLQQAERLTSGRENTLRELAGQNPVDWLRTAPAGYIGEQSCVAVMAAGQWCWDKGQKVLYYFPQQKNWLKSARNLPWLTWRVGSPQHPAVFRPGNFRLQAETESTPAGQ
jgi:hypothetical protein